MEDFLIMVLYKKSKYVNIINNKTNNSIIRFNREGCVMGKIKIELELEDINSIKNLVISRVNELRDKVSNDPDREEELKQIIRYYKQIVKDIENQIE